MSRPALFAAVVLTLAGCGGKLADRFPDDPDELIVYSIDGPAWWKADDSTPQGWEGEVLLGYPVLGQVEVTDAERRRAVLSALKKAAGYAGGTAACFIPRHAIRVVKGGRVTHTVICFECRNYQVYRGESRTTQEGGGISSDAQPVLDQILQDAGVPLAAKGGPG